MRLLLLCMFGLHYISGIEQITFSQPVTFEKNLHLSVPSNFESIVIYEGCVFEREFPAPLKIQIENLFINPSQTADTNIVTIGNKKSKSFTFVQFPDLLDASTITADLRHIGVDDASQVHISGAAPPPADLKTPNLVVDTLYGNDSDTLLFEASNQSILIGNQAGDLTCNGNRVIFTSPINTTQRTELNFNSNITTNVLTATELVANETSIGTVNQSNCTMNTTTTSINTAQMNNTNFSLGQVAQPLTSLDITTAYISKNTAAGTFSFQGLGTDKNILITLKDVPNLTTTPPTQLLFLNSDNTPALIKTSVKNVIAQEITCETICTQNSYPLYLEAPYDTVTINTQGAPITAMKDSFFILSGFQEILAEIQVPQLNIKTPLSVTFSSAIIENLVSSVVNPQFLCTIENLMIPALATVTCSNQTIKLTCTPVNPSPSDYNLYRYFVINASTQQVGKSTNTIQNQMQIQRNQKKQGSIELQPKLFSYKNEYCSDLCPKTNETKKRIGFIAEDLEQLDVENLLQYDKENNIVSYDPLILGQAIQQILDNLENNFQDPDTAFIFLSLIENKINALKKATQYYYNMEQVLTEFAEELEPENY